ncbi:hypothetical protein MPTK1_5g21750 [Marchantia polymorpha subsp. ruderalis]|uniref:Uncharacterized protein n=1 Tax=Marchantia polymorpha subsp. ruderalis TaxID=1480154 RepID=A0AAF6BKW3_MARPO|nr:hypothetical protein Mp_5g21750 [Marchantia polymorpha subsp. ruderalis]
MLLLCSSIQRDRRRESLTGLNATAAAKLQAAVIAALVPELLHFQGPLMSLTLTYRAPISISRLCGSRICFSSRRESRSSRSARLLARRCSWCAHVCQLYLVPSLDLILSSHVMSVGYGVSSDTQGDTI